MELNDVLLKRRSIRKYKKQVVKHEDIVTMTFEYARLAPSWKNSQVTRYHVIESEDILHQVKNALADLTKKIFKMHLF